MTQRVRDTINKIIAWNGTPYIAIILILSYLLFPIYWTFITSFKPSTEIFHWPPSFFPAHFTISNYLFVLTDTPTFLFIANSVIYSLGAAIFVLTVGTMTAYGLSIYRYKGSEKVGFTFLFTRIVPPQALWLPFTIFFTNMGLMDSRLAVIIFDIVLVYPLCVLMMKGIFDAFPQELIEAANIDGCSRLGALLRIVLPITAPGIAAVAIVAFLWSWAPFMFPFLILNRTELYPITVGIFSFVGDEGIQWGPISAAAMLAILPGLLFFTIAQRHIVSGLTKGAIK